MDRFIKLCGITLVLIVGAALSACYDGTSANDSPGTPPSGSPIVSPTIPIRGETGVASVDALIQAIKKRDFDAVKKLLLLAPEPCTAPIQGLGGPPVCEAGESVGTPIRVFPLASCEGYWAREDALLQAVSPLLQGNARLHGVYRTEQTLFDRRGDYAVIIDLSSAAAPHAANILVTDKGVVGVSFGCGESAAQLVHRLGLKNPLADGGAGGGNAGGCVDSSTDALCRLADELGRAAAARNARPFQLLADGGRPEAITCASTGLPLDATFLCEGAAPGEVRLGYRLAVHGSEGTILAPAGLRDMLSTHVAPGATLVSTGCSIDGCKTFVVAFNTGPSEPRIFYLAFEEINSGEHVLVAAGISGDNADVFLDGGETYTVGGQAKLVPWRP